MASKIEWTDETWNPVTGCSKVSTGCLHCYAERMARRLQGKGIAGYETVVGKDGWTGAVELVESKLTQPLHWRRPRTIFVCSMSDLFHEMIPDEWIDRVFKTIRKCLRHVFIILTKRPLRMQRYLQSHGAWTNRRPRHLWLGVTSENQDAADARIPLLLQCPAAVRFVSLEPLLEPVDVSPYLPCPCGGNICRHRKNIDWVICGGETGPGARPMHATWARSLCDQCQGANVPFFFKGWGGREHVGRILNGRTWDEMPPKETKK